MRSENRPKIFDQRPPIETSGESRNYTQNYGFFRNFGRGPSDRGFLDPNFDRNFRLGCIKGVQEGQSHFVQKLTFVSIVCLICAHSLSQGLGPDLHSLFASRKKMKSEEKIAIRNENLFLSLDQFTEGAPKKAIQVIF